MRRQRNAFSSQVLMKLPTAGTITFHLIQYFAMELCRCIYTSFKWTFRLYVWQKQINKDFKQLNYVKWKILIKGLCHTPYQSCYSSKHELPFADISLRNYEQLTDVGLSAASAVQVIRNVLYV
jgi:hypothetical protein